MHRPRPDAVSEIQRARQDGRRHRSQRRDSLRPVERGRDVIQHERLELARIPAASARRTASRIRSTCSDVSPSHASSMSFRFFPSRASHGTAATSFDGASVSSAATYKVYASVTSSATIKVASTIPRIARIAASNSVRRSFSSRPVNEDTSAQSASGTSTCASNVRRRRDAGAEPGRTGARHHQPSRHLDFVDEDEVERERQDRRHVCDQLATARRHHERVVAVLVNSGEPIHDLHRHRRDVRDPSVEQESRNRQIYRTPSEHEGVRVHRRPVHRLVEGRAVAEVHPGCDLQHSSRLGGGPDPRRSPPGPRPAGGGASASRWARPVPSSDSSALPTEAQVATKMCRFSAGEADWFGRTLAALLRHSARSTLSTSWSSRTAASSPRCCARSRAVSIAERSDASLRSK